MLQSCSFAVILLLTFIFGPRILVAQTALDSPLLALVAKHQSGPKLCKGVAIASHTVLTAGHCIQGVDAHQIDIHENGQWRRAQDSSVHPLFDLSERIPRYDVGLLTANGPSFSKVFPIYKSRPESDRDTFITYNLGKSVFEPAVGMKTLAIADIKSLLVNYIELRGDTRLDPILSKEIRERIENNDPLINDKLSRELGGFVFALFKTNGASICPGDSGAPAILLRNGKMGVFGIATAVADLEQERNPLCPQGGTSIFSTLGNSEIISFIKQYDSSVEFE